MLIMNTDENGNVTFQHVEDLPNNYESPEWKAYDQAFDEATAQGLPWTAKTKATYAAYDAARKRGFK